MKKNVIFLLHENATLLLLRHLFSMTLIDACIITVNTMTQLLHATDFSSLHFEVNNSPRRKRFNVVIIYKELSSMIDNENILDVVKRNPLFFHSISCKTNGFLFTTSNTWESISYVLYYVYITFTIFYLLI